MWQCKLKMQVTVTKLRTRWKQQMWEVSDVHPEKAGVSHDPAFTSIRGQQPNIKGCIFGTAFLRYKKCDKKYYVFLAWTHHVILLPSSYLSAMAKSNLRNSHSHIHYMKAMDTQTAFSHMSSHSFPNWLLSVLPTNWTTAILTLKIKCYCHWFSLLRALLQNVVVSK